MVLVIVIIWLDGCTDHATTDGDGDGGGKDDEIKINGDGKDNPIFQACHWSGYAG